MGHLLRPRMRPSFLESSGVGRCDVAFRYVSGPTPCGYQVARLPRLARMAGWHARLRGLGTAIHETSELAVRVERRL